MKRVVLNTFVFICFGSLAYADGLIQGCSNEVVQASAELVIDITLAVDKGTMAPTEKSKADILELEVRFCSKTESLKSACSKILPLQLAVLKMEQKKLAIGAATVGNVQQEIRTLAAYEAACKTK